MMEGNTPICVSSFHFVLQAGYHLRSFCAVLPKDSIGHRWCLGWMLVALRLSPLTENIHFLSFFVLFIWTQYLIPGSHTAAKPSSTSPLLSHQRYLTRPRPRTIRFNPHKHHQHQAFYRQPQRTGVAVPRVQVLVRTWKFRGRMRGSDRILRRRYARRSTGYLRLDGR
jgi:hypothetical protein